MSLMRNMWRWGLAGIFTLGLIAGSSTGVQAQQATPTGTAVTAAAEPAASSAQQGTTQDGFANFFRKTELFGTADFYYIYSFNKPETASLIPLRAFDSQHNQFSLALAEIGLSKPASSDDRVGFRFDFDFGPVADAVNAVEPGGDTFRNIQQAYISYLAPAGTGLTIDFGRFVTQHGAEVIEAKDNWNYSRSLLFTWAIPFYHTGIRLTYAPNDKVSVGGTISNGWNNSIENNSAKTYSVMATIKPTAAISIAQNYMGGPEQPGDTDDWRHLYDGTLTYTANDKVSVMANYDWGHDTVAGRDVNWSGIALYAKAQPTPVFALIPRVEFYDDSDGVTTGIAQKLKEFTLTAEVKQSQGLILRLEYRRDWSDVDFFSKSSGPVNNQNTFAVGFIYGFSSK